MGLDLLVEAASNVCSVLLPIVAVVALIFLIVLLYHAIKAAKKSTLMMDDLSKTLRSADRQINALDGPLHTLNELSETVDQIHDVSRNLVRSALVAVLENLSLIRDWIKAKVNPDHKMSQQDEDVSE